eukprot:scaffold426_cov219-Amphora_coffeaeformis.AAC.23
MHTCRGFVVSPRKKSLAVIACRDEGEADSWVQSVVVSSGFHVHHGFWTRGIRQRQQHTKYNRKAKHFLATLLFLDRCNT